MVSRSLCGGKGRKVEMVGRAEEVSISKWKLV